MKTYRKKPITVQAVRWDGTAEGAVPIIDWILAGDSTAHYRCDDSRRCAATDDDTPHTIAISTLEGTMHAAPGDFVIRGVEGEFYPCKPTIFEATYEPVAADLPGEDA